MILLPNFQGSVYGNSLGTGTQLPAKESLVARFSAGDLSIADGADVTSWLDSINFINADMVGGVPPILTRNRLNGNPSVRFNGSSSLGISIPGALKTAIDSQDCTVFIIFRSLGSSSGSLFSASVGGNSFALYADGTNVGRSTAISVPYAGQTNFSTIGVSSFKTTANYSQTNELETFYVNGGAVTNIATAMPGSSDHVFSIGNGVDAEIFDILVWSVPLTPPQYMQVQKWACDRYAQPYPWAGLTSYNTFFGDGLMAGVGATNITKQPCWIAAQTIGLSFGQWSCIGIDGISLDHMGDLAPTWIDPIPSLIGKVQNLISFEWYNQRDSSSAKGELFLADRKAIANQKTVWGTSTSASAIDPSSVRASYNAAWDAYWAGPATNIDSYMPLHSDLTIGSDGTYVNFSSGGDGQHLTDFTYQYLAALFVNGIHDLSAPHLNYVLATSMVDFRNTYILGL
jgi:hypothetical protein